MFNLLLKMTSYLPNSYSGYVKPWDKGHYFSCQFAYSSSGIRSGFFNVGNVSIKDRSLWAERMKAYRSVPDMQMYFGTDINKRAMQVDAGVQLLGSTVTREFTTAGIGVPDAGKNPKPYTLKYGYLRNFDYYGDKAGDDQNRAVNIYAMSIAQTVPKYFDKVFYGTLFEDNYVKADADTTTGEGGKKVTYVDDCAPAEEWDVTLTLPTTPEEALALWQEILGKFYDYTDIINKDTIGRSVNQGIQRYFVVPMLILRKFKQIAAWIPHAIPYKNSDELSELPWHDSDAVLRLSDDIIIVGMEKEDMPTATNTAGDACRLALFTYPNTFQLGIQDLGADEIFYDTGMTLEQTATFVRMIEAAKQSGNLYSAFTDQDISLDSIDIKKYEGMNWGTMSKLGFREMQKVFGGKALMFPPSMLDLLFDLRPLSNDADHSKEGIFSAEYYYSGIRTKPKQMLPVLFKESDIVFFSALDAKTHTTAKTKK